MHSRLIPLDPFIIWVPCFVPVLHSSSSWDLCSFLALLKILLKYLFTAQVKSVFKTKTWKNPPWLVLFQMSVTDPSYLLQFRGSWGEGRVAFCCGLRAQRLQGQSTGLPPGIFHILTTLHGLPRLELADPLPTFPPACRSVLQCPSPWDALLH